jgi:hypothetical protein
MWWFFGVVLVFLLILMIYERYCFFMEKFEDPHFNSSHLFPKKR